MDSNQVFNTRLSCRVEKTDYHSFYNLIDYRNNFFTSSETDKIVEFYDQFENRDQLIEWMRERPKGASYIHEVDGNKDIIVVITTADFEGKYAKTCRDEIFKGLHMVFVESGVKDFYFNYAHNCNVGIIRAMEYNPKWVIISNDDMVKIDEITTLVAELNLLENNKIMSVFTHPYPYHSYDTCIGIKKFFITNFVYYVYHLYPRERRQAFRISRKIMRKHGYNLKWVPGPRSNVMCKMFLSKPYIYKMTSSFSILSSVFCKKKGEVFNETYQNGVEDWELSIELSRLKTSIISYRIGDIIGGTFGNHHERAIRDISNNIYFNERIQQILST